MFSLLFFLIFQNFSLLHWKFIASLIVFTDSMAFSLTRTTKMKKKKRFTNENKLYRVVAVCCCVWICIISAFRWFCSAVKWSAGVYYLNLKKLLTMLINILNCLPTDDQFSTFPVGFVFFKNMCFKATSLIQLTPTIRVITVCSNLLQIRI